MNPSSFDSIARRFAARRLSRRSALRASVVGLAALAARGRLATAQQATPSPGRLADDGATLFVQTAASGAFMPNPAAGASATPAAAATPAPATRHGAYLLTLAGHSGETIFFADRPQRATGEVKTPRFLAGTGFFTPANPPNAALVADTAEQEDDVLLLELLNPSYDEGTMTLTYEADLLQQYQGEGLAPLAAQHRDQSIAEQFGAASLFIDDCPNFSNCCTFGIADQGPMPDGPIGTCWNDVTLCQPCSGLPFSFYEDDCNAAYTNCGHSCLLC